MPAETLQSALEREHRGIDRGIEAFAARPDDGAATPVIDAMRALRRHIYLEEAFLLPPLRAAGAAMPVLVMLREHGELWRTMDYLSALLGQGADSRRLGEACDEFLQQLDRHNTKEEPIIYPLADTALTAEARTELTRFLATGQTPDGWTCQHGRP
ncbi:MAG: hemerythrin domain-containing protein [Streptosporangiaceae bacterium]